MYHIKKNNQGQTIIEAVVALASIMLTLAAIAIAITTSLSNTNFLEDQSLASKYSHEGMEQVRYIRNTDPTYFNTILAGVYCLNEDNTIVSTAECGDGLGGYVNIADRFRREVEFSIGSNDCGGGIRVAVNVYYSSSKCPSGGSNERYCHNAQLISCFSNQSGSSTL